MNGRGTSFSMRRRRKRAGGREKGKDVSVSVSVSVSECVCVCVCCVVLWRLSGHKWPCDKKSYGICSCEFMQMVSISHIEEVNTFLQVLGRRKVINLRAP